MHRVSQRMQLIGLNNRFSWCFAVRTSKLLSIALGLVEATPHCFPLACVRQKAAKKNSTLKVHETCFGQVGEDVLGLPLVVQNSAESESLTVDSAHLISEATCAGRRGVCVCVCALTVFKT